MARLSSEVCTTSGRKPASTSFSPPATASPRPFSVRGTSTQPVNRFFAFQSLSPWRSRISVRGASPMAGSGGGCGGGGQPDVAELLGVRHHGGFDLGALPALEGERDPGELARLHGVAG